MTKIVSKQWGKELHFGQTNLYSGKVLYIKKNTRTSLHYHKKADKTHFVLSGKVNLIVNKKSYLLKPNDEVRVLPNEIHRIEALEDSIVLEVATPECEDDVVRIEDDYKRLTKDIIIRDSIHFITKENIIFTARGFSNGLNKVRAIPLYLSDKNGLRKSKYFDKKFTANVDEFGDKWLYKIKPEYIQNTNLGKVIFVPDNDIIQTFDPFDIPLETKVEISKTKFNQILTVLKETGIKEEDIGFIGSYLLGFQNKQSDIDILIRGIKNMKIIKTNINKLREKLGAVRFLDEKRKKETLEKYRKMYNFERNSFDSMISRRWSTIRIGDNIMVKLLFTYKKEEVPNDLPKGLEGECYVEGDVIDDEHTCFMPRKFTIRNDDGKFNVLTYFWHFYFCVKNGDKVGIFGRLSKDGKSIILNDRKSHGIVIKNAS